MKVRATYRMVKKLVYCNIILYACIVKVIFLESKLKSKTK